MTSAPASLHLGSRAAHHVSNSSGGIGFASRNPCASSHPRSRKKVSCAGVSMPSASVFYPSVFAMPMIAVLITASSGSSVTSFTEDRSIFRRSSGNLRRYASDE